MSTEDTPNDANPAAEAPEQRLQAEVASLRNQIEQQRARIIELERPRHWGSKGLIGSQAQAWHESLDRLIARLIVVRSFIRRLTKPGKRTNSSVRLRSNSQVGDSRFRQVAGLLAGADVDAARPAMQSFLDAADRSTATAEQVAWLALVAASGRYPNPNQVARLARAWRRGRGAAMKPLLQKECDRPAWERSHADLVILSDQVLIDVAHTAANDLHTGIQRVVREVSARWMTHEGATLVWWDMVEKRMRPLGEEETKRFLNWREHAGAATARSGENHSLEDAPSQTIVPWHCKLLIPEVPPETQRHESYSALRDAGVITMLSVIAYDMIPVTSAETMAQGLPEWFSRYLGMVKRCDRLSAISVSAADEFSAFNQMLAAEGRTGPGVAAHPLPSDPTPVTAADLDKTRDEMGIGADPVVLMIGSIEPRKNHVTVLEAAERAWERGHRFHFIVAGGSGWHSEDAYAEIERLAKAGRHITLAGRTSEAQLWSLYRLARFVMFPSLLEGYGLPIAEALVCGTPVITSNYGAMAEVARDGGTLVVNPRDSDDIAGAMERLLSDDELLASLRGQATARVWPTWDDYASATWNFLTTGE